MVKLPLCSTYNSWILLTANLAPIPTTHLTLPIATLFALNTTTLCDPFLILLYYYCYYILCSTKTKLGQLGFRTDSFLLKSPHLFNSNFPSNNKTGFLSLFLKISLPISKRKEYQDNTSADRVLSWNHILTPNISLKNATNSIILLA